MQVQNQNASQVDLRKFAGQFAAGVAVISTSDSNGKGTGVTMTAVLSLSLNPPLFLVSLANNSNTLDAINESGHFCINFLSDQQAEISNVFATKGEDKLKNVDFTHGLTGSPCIIGAVAMESVKSSSGMWPEIIRYSLVVSSEQRYMAGTHLCITAVNMFR